MKRPSLQRRLSRWLTTFILVAGLAAATVSFVLVHDRASVSQDAQLDQFAAALSRQRFVHLAPRHQPHDIEEAEMRFVVSAIGESPATANADVDVVFPDSLVDGLQTYVHDGTRWRVMVSRDSGGKRFAVAQTVEARDEVALQLALLVMLPMSLIVPAFLVVTHYGLRRTFAPLARLSRDADAIDESTSRSLVAGDAPAELMPFVEAVNRLLARLGVQLDQQRRLVSHAAHELRSPVHALVVQARNVRAVVEGRDALERVASLGTGLERISLLLDQLLGFARVQGRVGRPLRSMSFEEAIRTAVLAALPLATRKDIDLGCTHLDPIEVMADPEDVYLLVRNAIDNAVRYTPDGGSVDVCVRRRGDALCFMVEDTGPGIDADDLQRVFEPFVRLPNAGEVGSGLGLSIALAAAEAMGGSITLGNREGPRSGLRFVYRQAIAPASTDAAAA